MIKNVISVFLCAIICLVPTYAEDTVVELKYAKVQFNLETGWEYFKEMMGLPLVVTGPKSQSDSRLMISILPTNKPVPAWDDSKTGMELEFKDYKKGRSDWARSRGIVIKDFIAHTKEKWKALANDVHTAGVSYVAGGKTYLERTYYFKCQNQLMNIKILGEEYDFKNKHGVVDKFLNSFSCLTMVDAK